MYYYNSQNRIKRSPQSGFSWFGLYVIITMAVYILPYTKFVVPYIVAALLMLVSLPVLMLKRIKWRDFGIVLIAGSGFVMVVQYLLGTYGLTDSVNEMIRNVRFYLPALWACYALCYCNRKQRRNILIVFAALTVFILISTFIALEEDPEVVRNLASGKGQNAEVDAYRLRNVGGFEFSYMMGLVTLGLTWGFLNAEKREHKILFFLLVVLGFYYIIQAMYTTLLIMTACGMFALLFLHTKNPVAKVLFVTLAVMVIFLLEPVLKLLSEVFPSDSVLSEKFLRMYTAMHTDDIDAMGLRPGLLAASFNNWLKNPLFGGRVSDSNAHSLLMSTLELGGIVGLAIWLGIFYMCWKMVSTELKRSGLDPMLFHLSALFLLILSFMNPVGYVFEVTVAGFFVVPLWISWMGSVKQNDTGGSINGKMEE